MDIAALALKIDSTDVVKAEANLDGMAAAAKRTGAAAGAPAGSIAKLVASVQSMNSKLDIAIGTQRKAAAAMNDAAKAARAASAANADVTRTVASADSHVSAYARHLAEMAAAARAAAAGQGAAATEANRAGREFASADAHIQAYMEHLRRLSAVPPPAPPRPPVPPGRPVPPGADAGAAFQANTSNIAAQFQDIGVTAAMGMNPLMIALQQGTQLAAVFAQSGRSMGATIAAAFRQIASAQALMTIGLIAAVVVLIQMADWAKVGKLALNGLADAMIATAPYAAGLAAVLALAFAPQILSAITATAVAIGNTLKAAIIAATQAMIAFAIANPFTAFVLAAALAVTAVALVGKSFGKDFVTPIRDGINFVVGGFVGAFNAIKKTWSLLPSAIGDSVIQSANGVIRTVDGMVNKAIASINGLTAKVPGGNALQIGFRANSGQIANPNAGAAQRVNDVARESIAAAQRVDYVGKAIAGVNSLAEKGAAKLREWANALGAGGGKKKTGGAADEAASRVTKSPEADKWADIIKGADQQQRALDQAGERIGIYGQDLARLTRYQELLNAAQDKGLVLTTAQNAELANRAAAMAAKEYENTRKGSSEAGKIAHAESMRQLEVERGAIGLSGEALTAYNYQQQLINAELARGVALKDIDISKIGEQAQAYADAATANEVSRKAIDDQRAAMQANREAVKGFFTDWINGVRQGESIFKSFEKSVIKALNSVIDKLIEAALEQLLFNTIIKAAGGGGGGGDASTSIINLVTSLFANGGAFGTAQRFANGGAFTNQIVTAPTLFRFANGGKLGEMGEAGPEAIMPLSRGANGKLGVHVNGGGGRSGSTVTVNNEYKINGGFTPESAVAMIRQGGEATMSQVRRELQSMLAEIDQNGAVV